MVVNGYFILFSIMCKIIYLYLLYLVIIYETLSYASFVFLPELVSMAFLTGAFATELLVLGYVEHRVTSSVRRIGVDRYRKQLKIKRRIFKGYVALIIIFYLLLVVFSMKYNRKHVKEKDVKEHKFNEIVRTIFMSGLSCLAVAFTFPIISVLYIILQTRTKNRLNERY